MEIRIFIVMGLTFLITLIGTLAYSIRIVGVRTGKIAVSFALFNIFVLVSRTANTIQIPLLTKYVEDNTGTTILNSFYLVIGSAVIATIVGAILIPTFQRLFSSAVEKFSIERSVPRLILHGFSRNGISQFKTFVKLPSKDTVVGIDIKRLPIKILIFNVIAVAILVVGSLAPIYAGIIEPTLRATCMSLSGIINGVATVLLFIFIDPFLSIMTDDVVNGKCSEASFRRCVVGMVGTKIVGSILAFVPLLPAAHVIVIVAKLI
jgi:hypothetical protein